jgi:hypothetical protein
LLRVIRLRAWEEFQTPLGTTIRNTTCRDWIVSQPPQGLGSSPEKIEQLLRATDNANEALLAFDREMRGNHGGNHGGIPNPEGRNQHSPARGQSSERFKADNVSLEPPQSRERNSSYGNSSQAGLRRLERAANAGNGYAAEMLRRVLDKEDPLTVNAACVQLGWRKPVKTVVDTDDGMSDAVVRRLGPLDTVRQAWKRATADQRREIAIWINQQVTQEGP